MKDKMPIVVTNGGKVTFLEGSTTTVVDSSKNMLASQYNAAPIYNVNGVYAAVSPTGWTFDSGSRRMRSTSNDFGNLPSPSGSPYYRIIIGTGKHMTTTVEHPVIGRQYQISGFISNRPNYFESALDVQRSSL